MSDRKFGDGSEIDVSQTTRISSCDTRISIIDSLTSCSSSQKLNALCSDVEASFKERQLSSGDTELACALISALGFKPTSHEIIGHATACRVLKLLDSLIAQNDDGSTFYNEEVLVSVCSALEENRNSKTSRASFVVFGVLLV